jgi:hypothetical protein
MTNLPYTVTLVSPTVEALEQVQQWCHQLWPYNFGSTYYRDFPRLRRARGGLEYTCTWSFYFREDITMFLLMWAHLVESRAAVEGDG